MKQKTRWYWILAIFIPPFPLVLVVQSCIFGTDTYLCESGRRCEPGQVCAANQDVCIDIGGCGDGIVSAERGEVCDDGNIRDGDGCSKDCKSNETCGNGIVDMAVGETCDTADPTTAGACSPECLFQFCGNSIIDTYMMAGEQVREVCDDGNGISGDGCSSDCLSNEVCGNGLVDQEVNDAGVPILGDAGTPLLYEECDPAKVGLNTAECNYNCTVATCGDGFYNAETIIMAPDAGCPYGAECTGPTDAGVISYNEQCDPGVDGGTPLCDEDCTLPICGDGYTNDAAMEECDPGAVGENQPTCNANCKVADCPDGFWNPQHMITPTGETEERPEECDEGMDTANCDSDCTFPMCGDGHPNQSMEDCDSNGTDTATCDFDCTYPACGDGHHNALAPIANTDAGVEQCDEGGINAPNCDPDCTVPSCGDGYHNPEAPIANADAGTEQCDDGGDTPTCDSDCTPPSCGDGHWNQYRYLDGGLVEECEQDSDCVVGGAQCEGCKCI